MGKLVWHEYSRLVSLTASICEWHTVYAFLLQRLLNLCKDTIWAGFWGIFYRKFFWDFVGGILRAPGGLQYVPLYYCYIIIKLIYLVSRPSANSAIFITLIVKFPIVQILTILTAASMVALEYPLPLLKSTFLYRSIIIRIVMLIMQASMAILFYQVFIMPIFTLPMLVLILEGPGDKWGAVVADCSGLLWTRIMARRNDGRGER